MPDPVARAHFLKEEGDLESAQLRFAPAEKKAKPGLAHDLDAAIQSMKGVPWTALEELKGDSDLATKINEAEVRPFATHIPTPSARSANSSSDPGPKPSRDREGDA